MLSFQHATALTFDCYGTLIDWEAGILQAIHSVVEPRGIHVSDDDLLARFAAVESPIQQGAFKNYRTVLNLSMEALCRDLGFEPRDEEITAISDGLPSWQPFPDTVAALERLATRFQLGVISNVDDDLFAGSASHLGVTFDWVVTAEQVGSYKPSPENFCRAFDRIGRPRDQLVHCAQSLFHDIAPAQSLGLATVWVDRRAGKSGGATPPSSVIPDLTVPDLATLAAIATER